MKQARNKHKEKLLDEIKEVLSEQKCDAQKLVDLINHPEEKVVKVLRWLLDHKKIIMDDKHLLSWKEPDLFSR